MVAGESAHGECERWLLVDSGSLEGALAMAMDDLWVHQIGPGGRPILHLWKWARPAISVGYNQSLERFDLGRVAAAGVKLVRRPTGGKAVMHQGDLSFACIVPRPYRDWEKGLWPPYVFLADAIGAALREAGYPCAMPDLGPRESRGGDGVACGSEVYAHELVSGGRKILGCSQRRLARGLLVQGTIAPTGYSDLSPYLLAGAVPSPGAGRAPQPHHLAAEHLAAGFWRCHRIQFERKRFSPAWQEEIRVLAQERYADLAGCRTAVAESS